MGIGVADNFLDLSVPLDNGGFKPLNQVFVLAVGVGEVFPGDIELGISFDLEAGFGDGDHEFVQLGEELLLDIVGP